MDPEQPYCRDVGLDLVVNTSHDRMVTTSSKGLRGGHITSDIPTTHPYGIYIMGLMHSSLRLSLHLFLLGYECGMTHIYHYHIKHLHYHNVILTLLLHLLMIPMPQAFLLTELYRPLRSLATYYILPEFAVFSISFR